MISWSNLTRDFSGSPYIFLSEADTAEMNTANLDNIILALLFASDEPLTVKRISVVLDDLPAPTIREALERLEANFTGEDSPIHVDRVAGGHQLITSSRYTEYVARLYRGRRKQRLSKASMETLAIIAYKQPVTRADIENIRGVGCGGVVTTLMERSLIRIVGKAKVLGSPFLYGTTTEFLEYLGLDSLKDLPTLEDLEVLLEEEAASEPGDENDIESEPVLEEPPQEPDAAPTTEGPEPQPPAHSTHTEGWTGEAPSEEQPQGSGEEDDVSRG